MTNACRESLILYCKVVKLLNDGLQLAIQFAADVDFADLFWLRGLTQRISLKQC